MTHNDELRRNWRASWLGSVQELADRATQERMWLDKANTNPHFSFVEYLCCYFDGLRLEDGYQWAIDAGLLSNEEAMAAATLHSKFSGYRPPNGDYDHEAILADPKWNEVVHCAQQAQTALMGLIEDRDERRSLTEPYPNGS
jgi:hypothetical protein